jgi:hypothetical protein
VVGTCLSSTHWRTVLSVRYHIAYWAAAAWAIDLCLVELASPWQKKKKKKEKRKRSELALRTHKALVTNLLVALGSVTDYFQLPDNGSRSRRRSSTCYWLLSPSAYSSRLDRMYVASGPSILCDIFKVNYQGASDVISSLQACILCSAGRELNLMGGPGDTCSPAWPPFSAATRFSLASCSPRTESFE